MNEIDTVIREEDLSEQETIDLAMSLVEGDDNILGVQMAKQQALLGNEVEARTITSKFPGTSLSSALGKAYAMRDTIDDHSDRRVTVNPTGTMWSLDCHENNFYEMEVVIE